jgi:anti-sigma factor RsiW
MDCQTLRPLLVDYAAGRLPADTRAAADAHVATCAACARALAAERALGARLERLPRHTAPASLLRRLDALPGAAAPAAARAASDAPGGAGPSPPTPPPKGAPGRPDAARPNRPMPAIWAASLVSACAAAALVLVAMRVNAPDGGAPARGGPAELVAEAVNDHLRVVASTHPVEIESGGIHQVKPWFTGRLDFAPRVTFSGDDDFPLVGGSVGYFRDRKAAVFVFKHRLHTITLLVMPTEGLPWPTTGLVSVGRLSVAESTSRGFQTLLWRDGGLGYALVSDVNRGDLEALAAKIVAE